MADISKEINDFKTAIYGKDVRDSMVSMANKLNSEVESSTEAVQRYGEAEVLREQAENDRQNAENSRNQEFLGMQQSSQQATNAANEAAEKAEKYVLGDISEKTVTFQMAAERANIQSNDNLAVAFAKLSKFCSDLQEHAFNALVNNGLTTETGKYALDAAYGKLLRNDIDQLNSRLPSYSNISNVQSFSATDWIYLGTSVTVPSGKSAILFGARLWSSGMPTGICISSSNTEITSNNIVASNVISGSDDYSHYVITVTAIVPAGSYYLWSKSDNASSNVEQVSREYLRMIVFDN